MRILLAVAAFTLLACSDSKSPESSAPVSGNTPTERPGGEPVVEPQAVEPFELFGEELSTSAPVVDFKEIAAAPEKFKGKNLVTNGTVRASCLKRGCWMEVRPEDERDGVGIMVRFKDYGFFVPLNSRGSRARFEAVVNISKLSAAQVAEHEAEGGTVAEKNPDGSATVVLLMASGVELRGRKSGK